MRFWAMDNHAAARGVRVASAGKRPLVIARLAAFAGKNENWRDRNDRGAVLVLALVFLVVAALALTALVTFAGTGLVATAGLTPQRGLQYGADGATEIAIQHIRKLATDYTTFKNCLGPTSKSSVTLSQWQVTAKYRVYCQGKSVPDTALSTVTKITGTVITTSRLFTATHTSFLGYGVRGANIPTTPIPTIVAETTTAHTVTMSRPAKTGKPGKQIQLLSPFQRLVTFFACRGTKTGPTTSTACTTAAKAQTHYLVKALIGFGDRPKTGKAKCATHVTTTCGESVTVRQWTVSYANH
jgi:hypothetical protein